MEKEFFVDVPVVLFFFNRPSQTFEVFDAIKQARPSKLFLVQDGPREGNLGDVASIEKCRSIINDIDWDCQVYINFSDTNLGCGQRVSSGMTWVFEHVDRVVKLEDDSVPSITWFKFCALLLEKYNHDYRIGTIAGVNQVGVYEGGGHDYLFATVGSVAAFATWKRVWDNYDYNLNFSDNKYYMNLLKKIIYPNFISKYYIRKINDLRNSPLKRKSWSAPLGFAMYLNSQLNIIPAKNMITNIGLAPGATNGGTSMNAVPKRLQSIFNAKRYEIQFPLKHPEYIIEDRVYNDRVQYIVKGGKLFFNRFLFRIEYSIRVILIRYLKIIK